MLKKQVQMVIAVFLVGLVMFPVFTSAELLNQKKYVNYVALGDSLAAGVLYDNSLGDGYTDYISNHLESVGFQVDFNKNYAIPGYTSEQVLLGVQDVSNGLQEEIIDADMITLNAGANELLQLIELTPSGIIYNPTEIQQATKEVGENIGMTLTIIRQLNPNVAVYVLGYYNPFPYLPEEMQKQYKPALDGLNYVIEQAVTKTGGYYIPTEEAIAQNFQRYLPNPQNVHPSLLGYEVIADEFWSKIEPATTVLGKSTARLFGQNRYETAVAISEETFEKSDTVIIARGDQYPDALVATPLAYQLQAPILLTQSDSLSGETLDEIRRLGSSNAIILGGEKAVSSQIATQLDEQNLLVTRIGGGNRFETAALVAEELGGYTKAVLAYGYGFVDALAVSPYASTKGYPILLTESSVMPRETQSALEGVTSTYVVGGEAVINEDIMKNLIDPTRLEGDTRYETAAAVFTEFQGETTAAVVATGEDFADALTGSVYASVHHLPLLLVNTNELPIPTGELVTNNGIVDFVVLGGESAINEKVLWEIVK
ncbi:cell wall-binding repeat-containing protein [Bacillus sp. 2205SS5-2]|uniref:cell wall-binding repeat-containing protein n=1 Tax=Bacillus sp. 2205SS5-2 TaxID=3109031 RepID=UPI0030043C71